MPEPISLEMYQEAALLMAKIRHSAQKRINSGRRFVGSVSLDIDLRKELQHLTSTSHILKSVPIPPEHLKQLFEKFEEIVRRLEITIDPKLRPLIYNILSVELFNNSQFYKAGTGSKKQRGVMPVTVYHGDITGKVNVEKFPFFKNSPYAIRRFVIYKPTNPEATLTKARDTYHHILNPDNEADQDIREFFKDCLGTIKSFVINSLDNPQEGLRKAIKTYKHILDPGNKEDADIREFFETSLWAIKHFVIRNPREPQEALRKVIKIYNEILGISNTADEGQSNTADEDKRIREFFDGSTSVIKYIIIANITAPRKALSEIIRTYDLILSPDNEEYKDIREFFNGSKWAVKNLVAHNPTEPKTAIREAKERIEALRKARQDDLTSNRLTDNNIIYAGVSFSDAAKAKKYLDGIIIERTTGRAPSTTSPGRAA